MSFASRKTIGTALASALVAMGVGGASGCRSSSTAAPPVGGDHLCAAFGAPVPTETAKTCAHAPGSGKGLRAFAIGNVQDLAANTTYAAYCESFDRLVRAEVAPCIAIGAPNLLVFPEDSTLAASFLGARGDKARQKTISDAAFTNLAGAYSKPILYYQRKFPGLPAGRQLTLALTDVTWRVLHGVFGAMAKKYGVFVAVSANVAEAVETTDADAIDKLGDPGAPRGPVYEAKSADVWNASLLFDPTGALVGFEKKAYLVPAEEDPTATGPGAGGATLSLAYGPLPALDPIALPFGRVAAAISKDAWMPLVRDRYDAWGVEIVLQHEAFSGWTLEEHPGDWLPDVFMESGWTMTARAGSTRYVVAPMLTGNLVDLVFDGQSHVTKRPAFDDVLQGFVGNPPTRGFAAIAPWADTVDTERGALRAYGQSLAPGGARAGQYAGGVAIADLDVRLDGVYPAPKLATTPVEVGIWGASHVASGARPARHVAVATHGDLAALAWEAGPPGGGDLEVALLRGDSLEGPTRLSTAKARLPAIAYDGSGRLAVAWEQDTANGARIALSTSTDDGRSWSIAQLVDDTGGPQWMPALAGDPKAARFYVGWSDVRDGRSRLWVSTVESSPGKPVRIDPAHLDPTPRGDEWSVRLAADELGVQAAWVDFRAFSWDVLWSRSNDHGATFTPPVRVNDPGVPVGTPPEELERLQSDPSIALDSSGKPAIVWTSLQDRKALSSTAFDRMTVAGAFQTDVAVGPMVQPDVAVDAKGARIVGSAGHRIVLGSDGSKLLSDLPEGAHAVRPRIALLGTGKAIVTWDDDRSGHTEVRYAVGALP